MKKNEYDAVIIGAGVGGLVCGCYLAKSGFKVLIVEQQKKVGGCCTSFERKGYLFDVGVHYLGSCRENGGVIFNILKDFELLDKINLIDQDPHDRILTPHEDIYISKNVRRTIRELTKYFPKEEGNLKLFFEIATKEDLFRMYAQTKGINFQSFLNKIFCSQNLKSVLSIPIGNIGLPPSRAASFISLMLYREYILDGGYYPRGGIQKYPDLLALRFKQYGGELRLSTKVERILIDSKVKKQVVFDRDGVVTTRCIISNVDATHFFNKIISQKTEEKQKIKTLENSASAFVVYLGIKSSLEKFMKKNLCLWYFTDYDIEKCYNVQNNYNLEHSLRKKETIDYLVCHFPTFADSSLAPAGKSIIRTEMWVKHQDISSWEKDKELILNKIINKLKEIIPSIDDLIEVQEIATPYTINKWVSSANGSIFGWAATTDQENRNVFPSQTSVEGVYLTGSWTTNGFGQCGIPIVTLSGKNTANLVRRYLVNN